MTSTQQRSGRAVLVAMSNATAATRATGASTAVSVAVYGTGDASDIAVDNQLGSQRFAAQNPEVLRLHALALNACDEPANVVLAVRAFTGRPSIPRKPTGFH